MVTKVQNKQLLAAMVAKGMNQKQLAERAGVSPSCISTWLNGGSATASPKMVARVVAVMAMPSDLLGLPGGIPAGMATTATAICVAPEPLELDGDEQGWRAEWWHGPTEEWVHGGPRGGFLDAIEDVCGLDEIRRRVVHVASGTSIVFDGLAGERGGSYHGGN